MAAVGIGAYLLWRSLSRPRNARKGPSGGYCIGGVWIPEGASEPYIRDGALFYCPDGAESGCGGGEVRVDLENVDKRCI